MARDLCDFSVLRTSVNIYKLCSPNSCLLSVNILYQISIYSIIIPKGLISASQLTNVEDFILLLFFIVWAPVCAS